MNAPGTTSVAASVAAQVAALPCLPTKDLWALWDRFFPRRPENPNRSYLESQGRLQAAGGGLWRLVA